MIGDDVIRLMSQDQPDGHEARVRWFQVGSVKLTIMSMATFGLYDVYWFYKQWARLNETGNRSPVWPIWRALLTLIFCYSLFAEIEQSAVEAGLTRRFSPGLLALAFIALSLTGWMPGGWWALNFLSVIPLVLVQRLASAVEAANAPAPVRNTRLSLWNWLVVVPAALIWALVLVGTLVPAPPEDPLSQAHLSSVAAELSRGLPRALNRDTTLTAVSGLTGALVFHVRFVNLEAADSAAHRHASGVTTLLMRWECSDARLRRHLDLGVTIRHVFEDRDGRWIATLDVIGEGCAS